MSLEVYTKETHPIDGQKPGTSGLRKNTAVFMESPYTENFIQAILTAGTNIQNRIATGQKTALVLGGDGRYFVKESLSDIIIPMCAANGVDHVIVGQNGIMSTPAVSHVIRKREAQGGILLTASHNPGGPRADFGIKYNVANGGPAPEAVTEAIYQETRNLKEYKTLRSITALNLDLSTIGVQKYKLADGKEFTISIISSTEDYHEYMKQIFDFEAIRKLISGEGYDKPFKVVANAMNGVTGPYCRDILCKDLGLPEECAINSTPKSDFGGLHPDPNLTYAADLVAMVKGDASIELAAAFDGDGDRNMLLGGGGFFVCPCDSLAVIANNLECIPFFAGGKVAGKGFARSMPTSRAIDKVCEAKGLACFEVPTGWKFFGNLMDAGLCAVCGEESFGTGSDHIREKDGIWALLAWLCILACRKAAGKPASVEAVMREHWTTYGRHFFTRYDYEGLDSAHGDLIMKRLNGMVADASSIGRIFNIDGKAFKLEKCDNFAYVDPVDKSESKNQGVRMFFDSGVRLVFRLSGTGSSGATLRMYLDAYESDAAKHKMTAAEYLGKDIKLGVDLCGVAEISGRQGPTVIT